MIQSSRTMIIFAIIIIVSLFISAIGGYIMYRNNDYDMHRIGSTICTIGLLGVLIFVWIMPFVPKAQRESGPISYELMNSLEISVKDRRNGVNSVSENIIDYSGEDPYKLIFKKGDKVTIKIKESVENFSDKKHWNWRNARVYIVVGEDLYEISRTEIENQGIDELLQRLYEKEKEKR